MLIKMYGRFKGIKLKSANVGEKLERFIINKKILFIKVG